MLKKIFKWIFKAELQQLETEVRKAKEAVLNCEAMDKRIRSLLSNIDVSVDVHESRTYSRSWAVISLQGQKADYIKFFDLGDNDIREIQKFLRMFERDINIKIDATPQVSGFLRIKR